MKNIIDHIAVDTTLESIRAIAQQTASASIERVDAGAKLKAQAKEQGTVIERFLKKNS
ncbi:MAG: hypothetical protein LBN22_02200 [Clostridiales Family XIII bacterium]|nr:hypothetical protein [Clostridiales Family XIII bacterium]